MPPGQRRYEVQLSRKSGPIDVFLIQEPTNTNNPVNSHSNNHAAAANNHQNIQTKNSTTHFHASEMLKHFDIPMDAFTFEMKADEGAVDLYGNGSVDVYSVFDDRRI